MSNKKNNPINNYHTFKYVKQQLEQELLESEANLKNKLIDKVPFGLGNVLMNPEDKEGGLKDALKKEAINSSIPLVKNLMFSLFKKHKKRILVWGISAMSGFAISLLINNKLLKK